MSLNVALNTAVSGLFANQRAIAATSDNIANVNTPEFARREAQFRTDAIPDQFSGVDFTIARAAVDRFVQTAARTGRSDAAESNAVAEALRRIEASLGAPGENVSFANELDEAFAALTALSASPQSPVARREALLALDAAFASFARTSGAIEQEAIDSTERLTLGAARVNAILAEIVRLNEAVPNSLGAADLLDARLAELSDLIAFDVTRDDDGRVTVTAPDGTLLANSSGSAAFGVSAGSPAVISLSFVSSAGSSSLISADAGSSISGGELAGLLRLQNVELPALSALVSDAASGVAAALNAAHAQNTAVGATAPSGIDLIVASGTGFAVNPALLANPDLLAIARPGAGLAGGRADGAGAAALADVATDPSVRVANDAVGRIGSAARTASDRAVTDVALSTELSARATAQGGVNLDEELSNLILFQRAYNANARVIAAVDELWQALLAII